MAIAASNNMNMLFAKRLIEKSGRQRLILSDFFMADRTDSFETGFGFLEKMSTPHDNHKLIWHIHGAINFGNQIFTHKK